MNKKEEKTHLKNYTKKIDDIVKTFKKFSNVKSSLNDFIKDMSTFIKNIKILDYNDRLELFTYIVKKFEDNYDKFNISLFDFLKKIKIIPNAFLDIIKESYDYPFQEKQEIIMRLVFLSQNPSDLKKILFELDKKNCFDLDYYNLISASLLLIYNDVKEVISSEENNYKESELDFGLLDSFIIKSISNEIRSVVIYFSAKADMKKDGLNDFLKIISDDDKNLYYKNLIDYYSFKPDMKKELLNTLIKAINDKEVYIKDYIYSNLLEYYKDNNDNVLLLNTLIDFSKYLNSLLFGDEDNWYINSDTKIDDYLKSNSRILEHLIKTFNQNNDYENLRKTIENQFRIEEIYKVHNNVKKYIKEEDQKLVIQEIIKNIEKENSKRNYLNCEPFILYNLEGDYENIIRFIKKNSAKIDKLKAHVHLIKLIENKYNLYKSYTDEMIKFYTDGINLCLKFKLTQDIIKILEELKYIYFNILNDEEKYKIYINKLIEENKDKKTLIPKLKKLI